MPLRLDLPPGRLLVCLIIHTRTAHVSTVGRGSLSSHCSSLTCLLPVSSHFRFAHPTGRAIDQQQPPAVVQPSAAANSYALNPALLPQYMQLLAQPQPNFASTVGTGPPGLQPQHYSSSVTKPITSSNLDSSSSHSALPASSKRGGTGPAVCRYGRECHRDGCYFLHPEGRAVDDRRGGGAGGGGGGGRGSPSDDEVADALDEFESANGLTEEEEDEAAFRQYAASMGAYDEDDDDFVDSIVGSSDSRGGTDRPSGGGAVVDDTWKDEWFADSRLCDCCHGYVYRCERQQPTCQHGKCYCSAQRNGAHVQQAAGV